MKHIAINKQLRRNPVFRQRGASLLEGIAYLGIAAIVILGAVSLLTSAFSSASSNQASEEIISLRTAVKKMYAGQSYGSAANLLATLIPAKALPGTLIVDTADSTATNKWGGDVAVTGNGTTFTIKYTKVPQDVCVSAISGASGWTSIKQTGGTAITLNGGTATAANAATTCSVAGDNSVELVAS